MLSFFSLIQSSLKKSLLKYTGHELGRTPTAVWCATNEPPQITVKDLQHLLQFPCGGNSTTVYRRHHCTHAILLCILPLLPEHVLQGEPEDADGLHHGQHWVVHRVTLKVL